MDHDLSQLKMFAMSMPISMAAAVTARRRRGPLTQQFLYPQLTFTPTQTNLPTNLVIASVWQRMVTGVLIL